MITELRGPVVQSPIKANPGVVEILISIYLPLKEDFSQDESLNKKEICNLEPYWATIL